MWSGGTSPAWTTGALIGIVMWSTIAIVATVVYLAATAFAMRIRNVLRARRYNRYESTWEPILLDVLSDLASPSDLHSTVSRRSTPHFLKFLVRYARLLSGGDRKLIIDLARPYLPTTVKGLRSRRASKRAYTVQTLATLGMAEYGHRIARALGDRAQLVSMVAARTLSASRKPEYIDEVLENLHRYDHWNSRFLASMLASMGPEVAPALRSFLAAEGDQLDRAIAADSLGLLTDPAAAEIAAAVLAKRPGRDLAAACLRLLRTVGGPEHLPVVRDCATQSDHVLRSLAMRALGTIGEPIDLELLEQGMHDGEPWVAINAAEALNEAGASDLLRSLAESDHLPLAALAREVMMQEVA